MTDQEKFLKYLSEFQDDLHRLVSRGRKDFNVLSVEEIASNLNLTLMKKMDSIISFRDSEKGFNEFSFESFRYIVCIYSRKAPSWDHYRELGSKYVSRRNNSVIHTEEGSKTSFEIACETCGENADLDFDSKQKIEYYFEIIKDYSNWFTEIEVNILESLMKGQNQFNISNQMGVTHQAISASVINLKNKLRARIKIKLNEDCSWENIEIGMKAINDLFSPEKELQKNKNQREKDFEKIFEMVSEKPKHFTAQEICDLFEGKYHLHQVMGIFNKKKYKGWLKAKY